MSIKTISSNNYNNNHFCKIPVEIFAVALDYLQYPEPLSFRLVCKKANSIFSNLLQHESNSMIIKLDGTVTYEPFVPGSLHRYILWQERNNQLTCKPLQENLARLRKEISEKKRSENGDDYTEESSFRALFSHVRESRTMNPAPALQAAIVDDFLTLRIPPDGRFGLGHALTVIFSTRDSEHQNNCSKTIRLIFKHPRTKDILGTGNFGLGSILQSIIFVDKPQNGNFEAVQAILEHPNAKDIPGTGDYGLGEVLTTVISNSKNAFQNDNFAIVRAILEHPNAKDIPGTGDYGLGDALVTAVWNIRPENDNFPTIQAILKHQNTKDILAIEKWGLGNTLVSVLKNETFQDIAHEAAQEILFKIVQAIFTHPNANDIPEIDAIEIEDSLEKEECGLRKALELATSRNYSQIAQFLESKIRQLTSLSS